jgi:hypothetical protein
MRKRTGINRSAVERMAKKALTDGYTRHDFKGSLRRYLDALYYYNESANNIRVWSEKVWIFSDHTLITVLDLPQRYKNRANGIARKDSDD